MSEYPMYGGRGSADFQPKQYQSIAEVLLAFKAETIDPTGYDWLVRAFCGIFKGDNPETFDEQKFLDSLWTGG
jgi:hypothetical protein